MSTRTFQIDPGNTAWKSVLTTLGAYLRMEAATGRVMRVQVSDPKRSHEQNDRMWAMLTDVSEQLEWPIDGKTQRLSPEEWKDVLTAGLKREQRVAMGIDGGFVILGQRTSKMTKRELSDLMELIAAFGTERGVVFHEK